MSHIQNALIDEGFVLTDILFEPRVLENLLFNLEGIGAFNYEQPQIPNLLKASSQLVDIATNKTLLKLVDLTTAEKMFPVKAFILDKSTANNWEIPWHQDLKIAVKERTGLSGYLNWSSEAGILHVEPPVEVMDKLLTLRIHLDACDIKNAAIHVIPGSHKLGILSAGQIENLVANTPPYICCAEKNSIMLMKPLLVHYSPKSNSVGPRRILQIEYGYDTGNGMEWHE